MGPVYNESKDAKETTRFKRVLFVTELIVSGTKCT